MPINAVNIIYLRQLLKLRIFDTNQEEFYAPFCQAIFALLKRERLSEDEFFELVQGMSSYDEIGDIENYVAGDIR